MFLMVQLGVHLFSVFEMGVIKRKVERKFHEYLLHHIVAASLILFSTMCNQVAAGTMILIIHDMSDIFLSLGRFYIQTKYSTTSVAISLYLLMTSVWIYMRLFVYPFCLLKNVYANIPQPDDELYMIIFEYNYLLSMALVLFLLHVLWTYLLLWLGVKQIRGKPFTNNI